MKKVTIATLMLALSFGAYAQNEFDVLRYSNLDFYGDARFNAMGGSFGALGANMAAISINPGAIGVYKSSDFSFTPAFHYNYSESTHDGKLATDGKLNFHFGNVGLVGNFKVGGDWESFSFGIGYNRTSNYNTSISITGVTDSSALNTYVRELNANGGTFESDIIDFYPFTANLPYQTYLVNPTLLDSTQYDHVFANSKNITQLTTYETRGGSGEMYFAFGGNYNDKLFLGMSIGIPTVRYVYNRYYSETADESDTLTTFKSYSMNDYVKTTGAGVNLKLGMIYRINDWFRIGTAFHTPTVYSLSDQYETTMKSERKDGVTYESTTPYGSFNYYVTTPYRFVSSAAVIVGNKGVINADYEIVDYSTARIKEDTYYGGAGADFSQENINISNNFNLTQNIRVGTEWRLDPFRLRAGYRLQGNPISSKFSSDYSASIYSLGWGIKDDDYYFDMAYNMKTQNGEAIVVEDQQDYAQTSMVDHYITFTLGFRF
ncbi:MAG: outer membrane protein transport protein [Flavobacteriales bacterium]|nr:outer membrane protein transport protein [Flavobacteriales bacterium]